MLRLLHVIDYFCHGCGIVHRRTIFNAKRFFERIKLYSNIIICTCLCLSVFGNPMGIGNLISNFLFGGLGILDMMEVLALVF
ncbi:MAG: hypothetical protein ACLRZ2_04890 [Veillonella sp.]